MSLVFSRAATFCMALLSFQRAFADGPSRAEQRLGERIAEMMEVGYARGPRASSEAEGRYQSLLKDQSQDPRIDYAYGLVMQRLMKTPEAKESFLKATTRPGKPYLPAWQAMIWMDFTSKNYSVGYDHLLKFATLIQSSKDLSPEACVDAIDWMGRSMAALELTLEANQARSAWEQANSKLTALLGEDAAEDYERGKDDVKSRQASLEDDIQQFKEKAKKKQAAQLEKRQNRIEQSLEAVKEKRENLKKSAQEMKETLAEQTTAYQKQMTRLEKDFGFLERRSGVLMTTIATLDQETAVLQQRKKNSNNSQASNFDASIMQLQNQRMIYSAEFMKTMAATDEVVASAQRLNQERAEFLDQYQKATGEIVEADAGAEKWKERTLNQAKALKKSKETAKPPVPMAKIQAAKTYRTYVDLDPFAERAKLLDSFGLSVNAK